MNVIRSVREMQETAESLRRRGKTIGFVPTMGYLHEGHISLIRRAREKADQVVVSIFVNPAQFGPEEDLDRYPRDFEGDEKRTSEAGTDILFYPSAEALYIPGHSTWVTVENLTQGLCGASRPGHFRGVATICCKLFLIVKPHFAVFGAKDFQQAAVIRRMVRDLNFDLEIITAPIVRESDGLAMSSRNAYLSPEERMEAGLLNTALKEAETMIRSGSRDAAAVKQRIQDRIGNGEFTKVDYIEAVDPETLNPVKRIEGPVLLALAVFVGKTRLIDNRLVSL